MGTYIVIGLGSMGSRRVDHCITLGHTVYGYDIRQDRCESSNAKMFFENFCDLEKFIQSYEIDGIFICTPPSEHFRYIKWANDKNLNMFIEQPIVPTRAQIELCEGIDHGRQTRQNVKYVSHNMQFCQTIQKIKELLDAGKIQRPNSVIIECAEYLPDWHPYEPYVDYYPSSINMGGGLDVICDLDWLAYLFGELECINVSHIKLSDLAIDTPDIMDYIFRACHNDRIVQINIHEDFLQPSPVHIAKLVSKQETITINFLKNKIIIGSRDKGGELVFLREEEEEYSFGKLLNKKDWNWVEKAYLEDTRAYLKEIELKEIEGSSFYRAIKNTRELLKGIDEC